MSGKPVLVHGLEVAYYISDSHYVYGPFRNMNDLADWQESHKLKGEIRTFSLGTLHRIGTAEKADSVGIVLSRG